MYTVRGRWLAQAQRAHRFKPRPSIFVGTSSEYRRAIVLVWRARRPQKGFESIFENLDFADHFGAPSTNHCALFQRR